MLARAVPYCNCTMWCSALMDCVGCEKCRLWGKLQVLGLGTALKILFSVNGQEHSGQQVSVYDEVAGCVGCLQWISFPLLIVSATAPTK